MPSKEPSQLNNPWHKGAHCIPCEGGIPPIPKKEALALVHALMHWKLTGKKIQREWKFKNFVESMRFVEKVAVLAEEEEHHPDIHIHWNKVKLELWTHAINGLSQNDFILAHKIDQI